VVLGRPGRDRAQRQSRDAHGDIHDGKWKTIEGCVAIPDPALRRIEALEQKLGIKISDTAKE
jgi:hypothetical protein